ncbi:hypothetical protein HYU94_01845 [Candidatus Daviesbacteria bacterium]|nr:hypothetical protein [Candidatus Daviesbacteria bacterium]
MEDSRWLRLVTIGLVLAALAVGYFLFTGRFSQESKKSETQISQATPTASITATLRPTVLGQNTGSSPSPTPTSAYQAIISRNQQGTQVLPKTGFPAGLTAILAISALISGWGLRRFPH